MGNASIIIETLAAHLNAIGDELDAIIASASIPEDAGRRLFELGRRLRKAHGLAVDVAAVIEADERQ